MINTLKTILLFYNGKYRSNLCFPQMRDYRNSYGITSIHQLNESDMRTQEIREMEKRVEMYRRLWIWNLVFLLGLLCWGSVFGQNGEYISKKGVGLDQFYEFTRTKDDNIFGLAFLDHAFPIFDTISYVKINQQQNIIFKSFFPIYDIAFSVTNVVQDIDSNYIFGYNIFDLDSSLHLVKIDKNGSVAWDKKYRTDTSFYNQLTVLKNSLYIIGRKGISTNVKEHDISLRKFDTNGNVIWNKMFGGDSTEFNPFISSISDTNLVLIVNSYSDSSGNRTVKKTNGGDLWIIKIDTNGTIQKQTSLNRLNYLPYANDIVKTKSNGFQLSLENRGKYNLPNSGYSIVRYDNTLDLAWDSTIITNFTQRGPFNGLFDHHAFGNIFYFANETFFKLIKINDSGRIAWSQSYSFASTSSFLNQRLFITFYNNQFIVSSKFNFLNGNMIGSTSDQIKLLWLKQAKSKIQGSVFPDFNANCTYNKPNEFNIPKILIHNKTENTYAVTTDSIYTMYLFDRDTAVLKIINLDSNLYVACGKDSIVVDMTGKTDTSGIDFPIRSNKTGHCINITSFSSGLLRPGRWGDYQLNCQNNAFDTAYNAYIEIEVDTAAIDSIKSPYSFTLTGNILRFNLGHVRPFGFSSVTYSIKLKTSVIIGSSHCHRAKVFPICNLYPSAVYDSSEIQPMMRCLPNDTVEFTLKNIGLRDQKDWGYSIIYVDELILKKDSFKLTVGNSRIFKYKLDTNKVFTAEVFNSNFHPVTPILIRHNDLCANKRPMIPANPALNFSRHDEAKEYEEACTIVRGSYDPNMKSVLPVGMFSQHYTATGTELKYRLDFQNTGTDTAFRVVLVDTLSSFLDIASFVPGVSSHPYSIEFGGRAVKFIFDPIALVDSFKNEPLSHGYVCFKIKHKNGIAPKTKIENFVDIYFDYNAPVRTNTVFNTIFDTIQIYIPKVTDTVTDTTGSSGIQGLNKTSIMVFPNPTTDKFFIQMSEPVKDLSIEIYDMQGRLTKSVTSTNNQTLEVSAQGMTKGIYHIRVMSGEKLVVVKKVMVE
jgi:hypothetical protein